MIKKSIIGLCIALLLSISGRAQLPQALSQEAREFVSVDAPVVALTNACLIDGTGAPVSGIQVPSFRFSGFQVPGQTNAFQPAT